MAALLDSSGPIVTALLGEERVKVYRLGDDVAMLACPPMQDVDLAFGDVVQLARRDGRLAVQRLLRRGLGRTYRFHHRLCQERIATLMDELHWLGATPRANLREIVIGLPDGVQPSPVLRALVAAGVQDALSSLHEAEVLIA